MNSQRRVDQAASFGAFLLFVLMVIAGCTRTQGPKVAETGTEMAGESITVDALDFIENSGIKPSFPQIWIYDRNGALISTERAYRPGQSLNIESNKPGPVSADAGQLEKYLIAKGATFDRWRNCGAEYCVVRLLPAESVGNCPPCGEMQYQLDAYFSSQGAEVAYHTVLLDRLK